MGKPDRLLNMLKGFGYNVVRLPRTNIRPLQLFEKQDNDLVFLGDMHKLFIEGKNAPLPEIGSDELAGFINGQRTNDLSLSVGLSLLGGIIGALGGSTLGLDAGYKNASALSFEFNDVKLNQVDRLDLSRFLMAAKIDQAVGPPAKLVEADKIYVITSVIKSTKFTADAKQSDGTSVAVDVPVIQQALSGKLGVKMEGASQSRVTYEGQIPLVFGFQAIRLIYTDGIFSEAIPVGTGSVAAKDQVDSEPELLRTESPFTPIYIDPDA